MASGKRADGSRSTGKRPCTRDGAPPLRGRKWLGPRELLVDPGWSGALDWRDQSGFKLSGHRPDFVGFIGETRIAIEGELAGESRARLDAILNLHVAWAIARKTNGVIYICGDDEGRRRIGQAGERIGLPVTDHCLRIELLESIKAQTTANFDARRVSAAAVAVAA